MTAKDGKYLTFELGGHSYAIELCSIRNILDNWGEITPVPEFPSYSSGVINLRGSIVPVIDLRLRFGLPASNKVNMTCIIVTDSKGAVGSELLGFVVDRVDTVKDFFGDDISDPPSITTDKHEYLTGVYKDRERLSMILDPPALLTDKLARAIDDYMEKNG